MTLEQRPLAHPTLLGRTDLPVSEIGFGCARLGGFSGSDVSTAIDALHAAADAGVTLFDTSDMYTQGESERLLQRALSGRRERIVIATKVGYTLPSQRRFAAKLKPLLRPIVGRLLKRLPKETRAAVSGSLGQDFSDDHIVAAAHASVRRLGVDAIDLYQLHSPPREVIERGDFLAPLERLREQGIVRYYGVSCETVEDAVACLGYPEISVIQIPLSLLHQDAVEEVLPLARERGVGVIARECFAGGLLTRPVDQLGLDALIADPSARAAKQDEIEAYATIARDAGRSLPDLAAAFVRSIEGVDSFLLGMRTPAHVAANVELLSTPRLSAEAAQAITARWASHGSQTT